MDYPSPDTIYSSCSLIGLPLISDSADNNVDSTELLDQSVEESLHRGADGLSSALDVEPFAGCARDGVVWCLGGEVCEDLSPGWTGDE